VGCPCQRLPLYKFTTVNSPTEPQFSI